MNTVKTLAIAAAAIAMLSSTAAMADGNAEKGEKVFRKCAACHSVEPGKNKVGPSLFGVIGRKCGTAEGYKFSGGYKEACEKTGFVVDEAFLKDYLPDPSAKFSKMAGAKERSKMTFKLKKEKDIENVIEYLKTQK
jgi:cytochrome c